MYGKLQDKTVQAAGKAKLNAGAWQALLAMVLVSRDYERAREEHQNKVDIWARKNAPNVNVKSLQIASISIDQIEDIMSNKSRRSIQSGIKKLMDARIVTRVYQGIKWTPSVYVIGPLETSDDFLLLE